MQCKQYLKCSLHLWCMHFANVLKRFESNYQKSYEIHALLKFVYDTQNEFRVDSLFTLKNVCMEKQIRVSQKKLWVIDSQTKRRNSSVLHEFLLLWRMVVRSKMDSRFLTTRHISKGGKDTTELKIIE